MTTIAVPVAARSDRALQRLFTSARCRFAEDCLADAVSLGIEQVVLRGPCLDTFARHNPYPHLRVFDIRHPDAHIEQALAATDFDPQQPSFLIWLGGAESLIPTLHYASGLAPGTQIVFDYTAPEPIVAKTLHDSGFETLDHLAPETLAARYLALATAQHSGPHLVHATRR